jgi:hypothetical protein
VFVDDEGDGIALAVDHHVPGGIDLQDAFGYGVTQVLFLPHQLGVVAGVHIQDERVGLVQGVDRLVQVAALPI